MKKWNGSDFWSAVAMLCMVGIVVGIIFLFVGIDIGVPLLLISGWGLLGSVLLTYVIYAQEHDE